jgi:hypothetical protein
MACAKTKSATYVPVVSLCVRGCLYVNADTRVGLKPCHSTSGAKSLVSSQIYFTYVSNKVVESTRALIRFRPDGTGAELMGDSNQLAWGTPHGLRISHEANGSFLYHANNNQMLYKTTLDGTLVWATNATYFFAGTKYWPIRPTDLVVIGAGIGIVADGYGSRCCFLFERSFTFSLCVSPGFREKN